MRNRRRMIQLSAMPECFPDGFPFSHESNNLDLVAATWAKQRVGFENLAIFSDHSVKTMVYFSIMMGL